MGEGTHNPRVYCSSVFFFYYAYIYFKLSTIIPFRLFWVSKVVSMAGLLPLSAVHTRNTFRRLTSRPSIGPQLIFLSTSEWNIEWHFKHKKLMFSIFFYLTSQNYFFYQLWREKNIWRPISRPIQITKSNQVCVQFKSIGGQNNAWVGSKFCTVLFWPTADFPQCKLMNGVSVCIISPYPSPRIAKYQCIPHFPPKTNPFKMLCFVLFC